MYVRPDKQHEIAPLQLSHFHDRAIGQLQHWSNQFVMTGTMDYSPYFCIATAIDFFEKTVENGWNGVRAYNHNLALAARQLLAETLETPLPAPENMVGNLANILLHPDVAPPAYGYNYSEGLQDCLFHEYGIEVPIFYIKNKETGKTAQYVRIACQLYNALPQYEYLAEALKKVLHK
jgi:isopenicillin-N epimerase